MKTIIGALCALWLGIGAMSAQNGNTAVEITDYREKDNKIIIELLVNGVRADFVLDLAGHPAILPEWVQKLKIDPSKSGNLPYDGFLYRQVKTAGTVAIDNISMGNNAYATDITAFILEDEPYLRQLGVAGVVNGILFRNCVLTIDARRKKITTSTPYRPPYMKANMREDMQLISGLAAKIPVVVDGKPVQVLFDTWHDVDLALTPEDFSTLASGREHGEAMLSKGYGKSTPETVRTFAGGLRFVKSDIADITVAEDENLRPYSMIGNGILRQGLVSIDYGRQKIYFQPFDFAAVEDETTSSPIEIVPGKLNEITRDYFLEYVHDYKKEGEFRLKGDKPVVIDFWATWCGPCMSMMPAMEALAEKYKDNVLFYKVNADKEKELCSIFNVSALPTLFFIPVGGKPVVEIGATPERYGQLIEELLLQ